MISDSVNLVLRIIIDIILLVGVFAMPFWLLAVLAFIGLIYFRSFWEFMAVFIITDLLYAVPEAKFGGSVFVLTIISVIVYFVADFIKNKLIVSRLQQYVS